MGAVACTILPGGRPVAVTGSHDGTVRVSDLATGTPARELAGHTGRVFAVACTVLPGGQPVAVTASDDDTVRVWNLATGRVIRVPCRSRNHGSTAEASITDRPRGSGNCLLERLDRTSPLCEKRR